MIKRSVLFALSAALVSGQVPAAPYTEAKIVITAKGKKLLCKSTIQARSRIPKRECLEVEDWEKMSDRTQRGWHEWLYMEGGKCAQTC